MKYTLLPLFVLAFCSGVYAADTQPEAPAAAPAVKVAAHDDRFPDIDLKNLSKLVAEKKVVLIDCNGAESYKAGHIPGAISFATQGADLAKLLPADKSALVVSYCGGIFCPAYKQGAEAALKLGYTNVKHFPGGISGWKEAGEKTE
jgi:rhodanese-related sulfurtransferase